MLNNMQAHEQNGQEKVRAARHPPPSTISGKSKRKFSICWIIYLSQINTQISNLIDFRRWNNKPNSM